MARLNEPGEHHVAMTVHGLRSAVELLTQMKLDPRTAPYVLEECEDIQAARDDLTALLSAIFVAQQVNDLIGMAAE